MTGMSSPQVLVSGTEDLVSLPEVYFRVKALVQDPEAGVSDFADVISCDPGLSARFLRVANSAYFGLRGRVETLPRAIAIMGTQQVHDIVLATSVAWAFSGLPSSLVDMEQFWRRSVYCAIVSRLLAERCEILDSERVFVEGLLSDVGHLIMYLKVPGQLRQALLQAQQEQSPLHLMERKLVGCDYAQVGGELMAMWGLPESLHTVVRYHTEPSVAQEHRLETSIVHLAAAITADSLGAGSAPPFEFEPVAREVSGLSEADMDAVKGSADQELSKVLDLFFPKAA